MVTLVNSDQPTEEWSHSGVSWAAILAGTVAAAALTIVLASGAGAAASMVWAHNRYASGAANGTDPITYFTDMRFRSDHPGQADINASKTEVAQILAGSLAKGNSSDSDKAYIAQVVSRQTAIGQADAEKRSMIPWRRRKRRRNRPLTSRNKWPTPRARKVAVSSAALWVVGILIGRGASDRGVFGKLYGNGWRTTSFTRHGGKSVRGSMTVRFKR